MAENEQNPVGDRILHPDDDRNCFGFGTSALRFALRADYRDGNHALLRGPVVPRVASSVLNHAITRLEKDLSSVVQFEIHFARDNYVEVDCVSSVHPRMIQF